MISGDDPRTVAALATQAGLGDELTSYSGAELARFDEHEPRRRPSTARSSGASLPSRRRHLAAALLGAATTWPWSATA